MFLCSYSTVHDGKCLALLPSDKTKCPDCWKKALLSCCWMNWTLWWDQKSLSGAIFSCVSFSGFNGSVWSQTPSLVRRVHPEGDVSHFHLLPSFYCTYVGLSWREYLRLTELCERLWGHREQREAESRNNCCEKRVHYRLFKTALHQCRNKAWSHSICV